MGQNSMIRYFFARRAKQALAKDQSPPQELEVGPRSGTYLLVIITKQTKLDILLNSNLVLYLFSLLLESIKKTRSFPKKIQLL